MDARFSCRMSIAFLLVNGHKQKSSSDFAVLACKIVYIALPSMIRNFRYINGTGDNLTYFVGYTYI